MTSDHVEQIVEMAKSLSTLEKIELIERVLALLKEDIIKAQRQQPPESSAGTGKSNSPV